MPTRVRLTLFFVLFIAITSTLFAAEKTSYHFWKSSTGTYVAEVGVPKEFFVQKTYYLSTDGINFERALEVGLLEDGYITKLSFSIPATERNGVLIIDEEHKTLKLDGKPLTATALIAEKVNFKHFPRTRLPRNLLQGGDGTFVLVSGDTYPEGEPYGDIKLFIGGANGLHEVPILQREFTRCGAYSLKTAQGWLEYHTPDVVETPPTWLGQRLHELDFQTFSVKEAGIVAVVKPIK